MKNLHFYLAVLFTSFSLFIQAQWTPVGDATTPGSGVVVTNIVISTTDTPYLYYYDDVNAIPVALKYDGANWNNMGTGLSSLTGVSNNQASDFALGLDSIGYITCGNAGTLTVLNCVSGTWSALGSTGVTAYIETAIAIDANNIPYVAYTKAATVPTDPDSCVVIKYTGSSWTQQGPTFPAHSISITVGNNTPYVLFSDVNNFCNVVKFDGSNWINMGSKAFSNEGVSGSAIQIGNNGTIYVAYSDTSNGNLAGNVSVVKLVDTTWTSIGNTQFAAGKLSTHHSLAIDSAGYPFVAIISANQISVMSNFGPSWFNVGPGNFAPESYSANSSIALSSSGIPYVAYDTSAFNRVIVEDYIGVINSIKDLKISAMQVYPNPAIDFINLNLPPAEHGLISLVDITGQTLMSVDQNETSLQRLDLSHVAPGIYVLNYKSGETSLVAKIVKQ